MTLYLDTSSLVKLYVTETGSDSVRQLVRDASIVATWIVSGRTISVCLPESPAFRRLSTTRA